MLQSYVYEKGNGFVFSEYYDGHTWTTLDDCLGRIVKIDDCLRRIVKERLGKNLSR